MAIRIGINGFGRIGRQVYRAIRERYDKEIDVVAVNDIGRINIMTHLLKYDSTTVVFPATLSLVKTVSWPVATRSRFLRSAILRVCHGPSWALILSLNQPASFANETRQNCISMPARKK